MAPPTTHHDSHRFASTFSIFQPMRGTLALATDSHLAYPLFQVTHYRDADKRRTWTLHSGPSVTTPMLSQAKVLETGRTKRQERITIQLQGVTRLVSGGEVYAPEIRSFDLVAKLGWKKFFEFEYCSEWERARGVPPQTYRWKCSACLEILELGERNNRGPYRHKLVRMSDLRVVAMFAYKRPWDRMALGMGYHVGSFVWLGARLGGEFEVVALMGLLVKVRYDSYHLN